MKKWGTAVAVVVGLAGVGALVYWQWDAIWTFVFSPIGGIVAKVLLTGKAVKVAVGVAFAIGAGVVAARKKLRRGTREPETEHAPPVFGPPVENLPPSAPDEPGAPDATPAMPPAAPPAPAPPAPGVPVSVGSAAPAPPVAH